MTSHTYERREAGEDQALFTCPTCGRRIIVPLLTDGTLQLWNRHIENEGDAATRHGWGAGVDIGNIEIGL